eukprot:1889896-Prymnesium_polylepis.1
MEVRGDHCSPLYEGQPHCSEVVATMAGLGLRLAPKLRCPPPGSRLWRICEYQMRFMNVTRQRVQHGITVRERGLRTSPN